MAEKTKQDKAPAKQWRFKQHSDRVTAVGTLGHLNHSTKPLKVVVPRIYANRQVGKLTKEVPVPSQSFLAMLAKQYPEVAAKYLVFE